MQQVTAGSLGVSISTGLVDPLRAVGMGAPICRRAHRGAGAALRSGRQAEHQEPQPISRARSSRSAAPRTSPASMSSACWRRTASSGAISTWCSPAPPRRAPRRWRPARSMPRFSCRRSISRPMAKGFNSLGLTVDYAKDLPFSGTAVNNAWAKANKARWRSCCGRRTRASPGSRTANNREEAVSILQDRQRPDRRRHREGLRLLPRRPLLRADRKGVAQQSSTALAKAMESLGDMPGALDVDKVVLPGVTQVTD